MATKLQLITDLYLIDPKHDITDKVDDDKLNNIAEDAFDEVLDSYHTERDLLLIHVARYMKRDINLILKLIHQNRLLHIDLREQIMCYMIIKTVDSLNL
jgi:hypothetical protein